MEDLKNKLTHYVEIRSFFYRYLLVYLSEKGIDKEDVYDWILSESWVVVKYWSEETENDEEMDIPMDEFLNYIKSKDGKLK